MRRDGRRRGFYHPPRQQQSRKPRARPPPTPCRRSHDGKARRRLTRTHQPFCLPPACRRRRQAGGRQKGKRLGGPGRLACQSPFRRHRVGGEAPIAPLRAVTLSMSAGDACRLGADANRGDRTFSAGAREPIPAAIRGPRATRHENADNWRDGAVGSCGSQRCCVCVGDGPAGLFSGRFWPDNMVRTTILRGLSECFIRPAMALRPDRSARREHGGSSQGTGEGGRGVTQARSCPVPGARQAKLLDQVRHRCRVRHVARKTEYAYVN